MASSAGKFPLLMLGDARAVFPQHNPESAAPGLPVKATHLICQGVMVAYDPANSQAQCADPAMAATARVIGFNTGDSVDNLLGAKGAVKIKPQAGVGRVKSDGNLTAAHLFTRVRVIDDHTVGVPAGTDADRIAGLLVGLDGDFAWVAICPEDAQRGPITVTLTSTNGTAGAAADLAALKAEAEKIGDDVRALHAALATLNIVAPAA
jgi:hypothetical protein